MTPRGPERFEFADAYRGPMACLEWRSGKATFTVLLTEWPASFLSAYRAGVLGPKAEAEARLLLAGATTPCPDAST